VAFFAGDGLSVLAQLGQQGRLEPRVGVRHLDQPDRRLDAIARQLGILEVGPHNIVGLPIPPDELRRDPNVKAAAVPFARLGEHLQVLAAAPATPAGSERFVVAAPSLGALIDRAADAEFVVTVGDAFRQCDPELAIEIMAGFVAAELIGNHILHGSDSPARHCRGELDEAAEADLRSGWIGHGSALRRVRIVARRHRTHDTVRGKRFVREVEQMLQLA